MRRICCLCGNEIIERRKDLPGSLSMDHAPMKQIYLQAVLRARNLNLWTVPSHKACNNNYQNDEDYFLHRLYPLVANGNPKMAEAILDDIKRRAKKPQSRAFIRDFLKDCTTRTEGGFGFLHQSLNSISVNCESTEWLLRSSKAFISTNSRRSCPEKISRTCGYAKRRTRRPSCTKLVGNFQTRPAWRKRFSLIAMLRLMGPAISAWSFGSRS
jgi:hypothetical protein